MSEVPSCLTEPSPFWRRVCLPARLCKTNKNVYLDVAVAPSEDGHDGQSADHDDLENDDRRPHSPV